MRHPWSGLKGLPRGIWVLFAATLINRTGTMFLPFLVLYLTESLGFPAPRAGLVLALYGVGGLVTAPLAGRLADAWGAVRVMKWSLAASGILLVLFPLARGTSSVALLSVALAVVTEAFRPASLSVVTHLVPPERRKSAFALSRLAVNLGMSVGPAAGGFLAAVSWPLLFIVDGATSLLSVLVLLLFPLSAAPPGGGMRESAPGNAPGPGRDPAFVFFLAALFPVAVVFFQHESTLALFLVKDLAVATWAYGLLHTVNTLLIVGLEVPLNLATAHWTHRRTLALGALLVGAGFGALVFVRDAAGAALTVVVWTFGEMLLLPGMSSYVADIAPAARRGAYMGLYSMAFSAAFATGPWLGTALFGRFGARPLWITTFALGALSAALFSTLKLAAPAPASRR